MYPVVKIFVSWFAHYSPIFIYFSSKEPRLKLHVGLWLECMAIYVHGEACIVGAV